MLLTAIGIHFVLFRTRWDCGRGPWRASLAADTLGINVIRTRYINVLVAGLIAGLGGAWFTLEAVDVFSPQMTNGLGFIGLAAMIFGKWTPFGALLGALIFGIGSSVTRRSVSSDRTSFPTAADAALPVDDHRPDGRRRPCGASRRRWHAVRERRLTAPC